MLCHVVVLRYEGKRRKLGALVDIENLRCDNNLRSGQSWSGLVRVGFGYGHIWGFKREMRWLKN